MISRGLPQARAAAALATCDVELSEKYAALFVTLQRVTRGLLQLVGEDACPPLQRVWRGETLRLHHRPTDVMRMITCPRVLGAIAAAADFGCVELLALPRLVSRDLP